MAEEDVPNERVYKSATAVIGPIFGGNQETVKIQFYDNGCINKVVISIETAIWLAHRLREITIGA